MTQDNNDSRQQQEQDDQTEYCDDDECSCCRSETDLIHNIYIPESVGMFDQDLNFFICISKREAEENLSQETKMLLTIDHNCECFDETPRKSINLLVTGNSDGIKKRHAIDEIVNIGYNPHCCHHYLEDIEIDRRLQKLRPIFSNC